MLGETVLVVGRRLEEGVSGAGGAFFRVLAEGSGTASGGSAVASGRRLSESRGEDVAQRVGLGGGIVPVRLRLVLEASAHADDGDGGVGEAGEVAGQPAGADAGAVLVEGEVADVVDARRKASAFSISQWPRSRARISDGPARSGGVV